MSYELTGRKFSKEMRARLILIILALTVGVIFGLAITKTPKCQYEDQALLSGGQCVAIDDL